MRRQWDVATPAGRPVNLIADHLTLAAYQKDEINDLTQAGPSLGEDVVAKHVAIGVRIPDVVGGVLRCDQTGLVEHHHGMLADRMDRLGWEDLAMSSRQEASLVEGQPDQGTRFRVVDHVAYLGYVLPTVDGDDGKPADLRGGHEKFSLLALGGDDASRPPTPTHDYEHHYGSHNENDCQYQPTDRVHLLSSYPVASPVLPWQDPANIVHSADTGFGSSHMNLCLMLFVGFGPTRSAAAPDGTARRQK